MMSLDFLAPRAASEPMIRTGDRVSIPRMRRSSTGDLSKHVHWSERSRVILVPARQDYWSRGVASDLWWEGKDYESFKLSAIAEVLQVMASKHLAVAAAMTDLYQPEPKKDFETTTKPSLSPCESDSISKAPTTSLIPPEMQPVNFLGIDSTRGRKKAKFQDEKPLNHMALMVPSL
jgi:hypothetical protein